MNERFMLIKPHITAAHVQATAQLGCSQHAADIVQHRAHGAAELLAYGTAVKLTQKK